MAAMLRRAPALALLLVTIPSLASEGAGWKWGGGTSPNMVSDAVRLPADLSSAQPLWERRFGTHQYSIPTIDRGRIFVGINDSGLQRPGVRRTGGGVLCCLDQATGETLWRFVTPRKMEGVRPPYHYNQWKSGFCSGPLVDGDRVYIVGGRGEVLCLDRDGQSDGNDGPFTDELAYMGVSGDGSTGLLPTDGDLIWRYDLVDGVESVPHDVCGSTLLLVGNHLWACTSNGLDHRHDQVANPRAPSLIVLDKRTGRLLATDKERIGERLLHGHWSSPCAAEVEGRTLVFFGGGDGILYAFESLAEEPSAKEIRTLRRAWKLDANPTDYRVRNGKPEPYSKHNRRIPNGPSEIIGTPVFAEGRVYVTIGQSPLHGEGQGCLSCVDAASGRLLWQSRRVARSLATPSVAGGLCYVVDTSGRLHAFDAVSGELVWDHDMGAGAWCASTFVADGKVYASTEGRILWVLRAGRKKEVLARNRLKSMAITPVAVDGVLYLPTQKRLIAYPGPVAPLTAAPLTAPVAAPFTGAPFTTAPLTAEAPPSAEPSAPAPAEPFAPASVPVEILERVRIPRIDLQGDADRRVVVDREPGQYLGHPTTCLLEDGKTILCVYPKGHGRGAIVYRRSEDGGRTWSERLPTPESWASSREVPTIHRVVDAAGTKRLIMWSGLYPARLAVSEDDGGSWSELASVGEWGGIVVMGFVEPVKTGAGHYLAMFHDDGRFIRGGPRRIHGSPASDSTGIMTLYRTWSRDGGLTWSAPDAVYASGDIHLCEPGCIRSPDGRQLAVLLRENARRKNSHVIFSSDEGKTWSEPRELPLSLTGDRHTGKYAPDGRLFISFRCRAPKDRVEGRPFEGDWVGWVGTYDDITAGREGQYFVRIQDNTRGYDTTYPGVEVLPDGTFVTTTYGHWTRGESPYILSVRFRLEELDAKAAASRSAPDPR